MATPRRPYVKLPLGYLEAARERVSEASTLMLARIALLDRRSVPGLHARGPAGFAEAMTAVAPNTVKRALKELEGAGLILTDLNGRPPLVYIVGSALSDPPTTENSVRGMSAQLRDLPVASPVVQSVMREIAEALADSQWLKTWESLTRHPESEPESKPGSRPDSGQRSGSAPGPLRIPIPNTDSKTAAAATKHNSRNAGFDLFWQAYPVKTAKDRALKAWQKRSPDDALTTLMLAAIERQRQSRKWREGYIPNPATWLNDGRWQDEPEPPSGNSSSGQPANCKYRHQPPCRDDAACTRKYLAGEDRERAAS